MASKLLFRANESIMPLITIFTPTFNRAHTIERTYKSLLMQSCKDFIWLIIDDGSTDNTFELIQRWQKQNNGFNIRYIYKENGGVHTAHNVAYENIDTELNMCIDSDDCIAIDAISKIVSKWNDVKQNDYAGIMSLNADFNGNILGKRFSNEQYETTVSGYYSNGGSGDKKLIYRTDVIKKYPPYPVFDKEKYLALAYKYRLIDQDYKMAILNDVICNVEYQPDGSTKTMWQQYLENPKGFAFWRKVCMRYPTSKKRLIVDCIHYVSSSILAKQKNFIQESPKKFICTLMLPFGYALSLYTKYKNR